MDAPEPAETPFQAVSAQTSRIGQVRRENLDGIDGNGDANGNDTDISNLPRQIDSICSTSMGWHVNSADAIHAEDSVGTRLVHRYVAIDFSIAQPYTQIMLC